MAEIIYVLINEAMPGLVKIGRTTDSVQSRISQLNSHSAVPLPFECFFAAEVPNAAKIESTLHQLFADDRVNMRREFFSVEPERVVLAISIGNFEEVVIKADPEDADDEAALSRVRARRPNINMEALGLKIGDVLVFSRDESITATVVSGGKVEFSGEITSPSGAALTALHSLGYKCPTANGYAYWMFDGELLTERRSRMESERFGAQGQAE